MQVHHLEDNVNVKSCIFQVVLNYVSVGTIQQSCLCKQWCYLLSSWLEWLFS